MEASAIDKNNLMTVGKYAKHIGKSRQWVYEMIKAGDLKTEVISGVTFIITK